MMNSKRVFYGMTAVVTLLSIGIIGSAYLGSQLLTSHAKTLSDLKLQNKVLNQEKTSLIKAKKDVAKYMPLESIAKTIVPQDKDQAEAVREITNIASATGITLSTITLPLSNLGLPAPTTTGATSISKSDLTQLTPVKGSTGLYVLKISVSQDAQSPVAYTKFIDFLAKLEQNRRTAQVSSITLQPYPQDRNLVTFTLNLDEYIKP
jgi:hypothetical protein